MNPSVYFFALGHLATDWSQGAIPALLPYFIAHYGLSVILGQTYLGRNAGFASGVTLGLSTTLGGIFAPMVGWAADMWGLQAALQILWAAGLLGVVVSFTLPPVKEEE